MSRAMRIPSPVLYGIPRTLASSSLPQVTCAHLGIGLKPTTGQNDRFAVQVCKAIWPLHCHANHTSLLVLQQTYPFVA